ncbi:MAG: alpha/beta fold hydrolase [Elusimicrobia bacterium]|nr:alpha/beta fold hydrolase [Elusimicrobiota bacterium]
MKLKLLFPFVFFFSAPLFAQQAGRERVEERVTLETDDGWKLNARYLRAAQSAPTLVLLHTQKSDLTEWNLWFPYLKKYGYGYLAPDLRGHGFSFIMPNGSTATYRSFAISGPDNEFNKMTRDVEAAVAYLSTNSVTSDRIVLAGSVLGANLAIKTAAIHQDIAMVIAISPALNINDVLSINPLRAYGKRPILLVAGADRARQYKEFQLINDIAKSACGKENVSVLVEAKGIGPELITKYNIKRVLDWLKNPRLPEIIQLSTGAVQDAAPKALSDDGNDRTEEEQAAYKDGNGE